jgi:hypothetical protein
VGGSRPRSRVEDHDAPLDELERLIRRWRAYGHAELAEEAELAQDADRALHRRLTALEIEPGNPEMAFWAAVSLADAGRAEEARSALQPVRPVAIAGRNCSGGASPKARWTWTPEPPRC